MRVYGSIWVQGDYVLYIYNTIHVPVPGNPDPIIHT